MTLREFRCIKQRVFANLDQRSDTDALVQEVERLRQALHEVLQMTGDPAIVRAVNDALEG